MEKDTFQFRQFLIRQDCCAMKVGTDGVLLGAWARSEGDGEILDIGCGTGLIALMMAQRFPEQRVTGLELDAQAARQAAQNVAASPFAARVSVVEGDVRQFQGQWGCIVCNPPFFSESTTSPDATRSLARSAQHLSFADLWKAVDSLLVPGGLFNVIIPMWEFVDFHRHALALGFTLERSTQVLTTPRKAPKRILLSYRHGVGEAQPREQLVLTAPGGGRSEALVELTREFYL